DAQQLAEAARKALRTVLGVAGGAAVPHPDVELAVRPELELPAVVVRVRLLDEEELAQPPGGGAPVRTRLADPGVALDAGVVDVELVVRAVLRMEGHRQQPLLAPGLHESPDV